MQVDLTPQDAQFLIECLDIAVKQRGLQIAAPALNLTTRLQHAAQTEAKAQAAPAPTRPAGEETPE